MTPEISVVIPTYNRLDTLQAVLEGFDRQTLPASKFEIIVVDSRSTDGTEHYAQKFRSRSGFQFRYFQQENRGRSGARNRGILEASGKIIVLNDSDIIPEKTFLERHAEFHETHPTCAAVGWESRIDSLSELAFAESHPEERFRIHSLKRKKLHWLYFLTGNASAPRASLLKAGLFDEAFQGYGYEDLELGYRLHKAGLEIHYLPGAVNYHVHVRTLENQAEVQRLAGRNAVLFYKKHKDWRIRWLLGMSPPAFFWHRLLKGWPLLYRWLENRAKRDGSRTFASKILIQHYYLLGVEETWT